MKKIFFLISFLLIFIISNAQLDSIVKFCTAYLKYPFISDGQQYRAILNNGEVAEFKFMFYGGSTYRIVAASNPQKSSAIFRVYDKKHNLLFSSLDYKEVTYWDFKFNSTVDCIIEAQLPENRQSGFIILLVGFKQN